MLERILIPLSKEDMMTDGLGLRDNVEAAILAKAGADDTMTGPGYSAGRRMNTINKNCNDKGAQCSAGVQ